LIRLDGGRVVVALDAQCRGDAVADIDDAGVLARADEHPLGLGGQPLQVDPRGLVRAVLGPHDRVHRQLEVVGRSSQDVGDLLGLVVGQPQCSVDRAFRGRLRCVGHGRERYPRPTKAIRSGGTTWSS
jgi:hypothetical protein